MNINFTDMEYNLVRRALEQLYYIAKDEGNKGEMRAIDALERKIIDAYNEG